MNNKNIEELLVYFKSGKFELVKKKASLYLKEFPNNYFLHNISGITLAKQKNYLKAIKYFQKAIEINSEVPEGHYNLGNALLEMERYDESVKYFQKAIKIKPDYAKSYKNLASVYYKLNYLEGAIECYKKTIEIDKNDLDVYHKLALLYCDIGKIQDAKKKFEELIELDPSNILYKINNALLLTPIYKSAQEIILFRNQFVEGLNQLKNYKYRTDQPAEEIELNFYYLAYHNENNVRLLKDISELFRKIIPNINYISKRINNKINNKKIKIGFISQFLTDHTVGKLFGGLIKEISKEKFHITIFHTYNTKDSIIKNKIDADVNKVINLKNKISEQQSQIENENLDIIFYPDIGMSPITYFLAFSRLAPIQIASWGHTETTGIDTIDYFISSTNFESKNAQEKYSEKLIFLNHIPTYFEPPKNITNLKNRFDLNLPENANLYGCPQSLFKLHPDCDVVFSKILEKDRNGYIILIGGEGKEKYWIEILKDRWSKKFPLLNEKIIFTKKLSLIEFLSLSNLVNVLLVPVHFGGGNTSLEAMIFGTPSITITGNYLRTNITTAIYKQMKIKNPPIAKNINEYIDLAIDLANDDKKKQINKGKIKRGCK